ncbi:alpha/beta fold hydrolase [Herbiconiux sp. P17]|uniref:alpha/beta fold hydrolase n=1 Tax=Herbiconiux wuyangfengii TaxID=3342794 RepID=UPI0035B7C4AE
MLASRATWAGGVVTMGVRERMRGSRAAGAVPLLHVAVDQGEGPVVVLLHGIASSSASWRLVVPYLSPLYRVIAIDVLGFGGSVGGAGVGFTLDEHVLALHKTIRSLHIRGRYTIVGHSLGALIAGRYAAVHRREISHVILASPPIYPDRRYIDELSHRLRVGGYLWFYRFVRSNKLTIINNAGRFSKWMPGGSMKIDEQSWLAFSKSLENCIETQTATTDVAQITVPVDIVFGSRDQVIVPATIERLGAMHHVELHEVAHTDHLIRAPLAREIARLVR